MLVERKRISVIGLDGASWDVVNLFIDRGLMPHLKHILDKSIKKTLYSTIPPITAAAWTSIASGATPIVHGVFDFQGIVYEGNKLKTKVLNSSDVQAPRIHEILNILNLKSIVINLPLTYPFHHQMINCKRNIIVTGWDSPKQLIYPIELMDKYKKYLIEPKHGILKYVLEPAEYSRILYEDFMLKMNLYYDMLNKFDWHLLFIVISELDWIMHSTTDILKGIIINDVRKLVTLIDKLINEMARSSDVVIIVSDHGFKIYDKVVNINAYFKRKGFVKVESIFYRKTHKRRPVPRVKMNKCHIQKRNMIYKYIKFSVKKVLSQLLNSRLEPYVLKIVNTILRDRYLSARPILSGSSVVMAIFGCIHVFEHNVDVWKLKEELNRLFSGLLKFYTLNEVYKDGVSVRRHQLLPSIIIEPIRAWIKYDSVGNIIENSEIPNHSMYGIFSVYRKDVIDDNLLAWLSDSKYVMTWDICPLILYLLDLPIPSYTTSSIKTISKLTKNYLSIYKVYRSVKGKAKQKIR